MAKKVPEEAEVHWEGDSLEVLRGFPKAVKQDFGADVYRLQLGVRPLDSRPMQSIGRGVFELRQRDDNGWYRLVYLSKVGNRLFMLHAFTKRSARTPKRDLLVAENRLKAVRARLAKEKRDDKNRK